MSKPLLPSHGERPGDRGKGLVDDGGVMPGEEYDVMRYAPPQGPKGINDPQGPGLHGHNCGQAGTQGPYATRGDGSSGRPGLGGTNYGNNPSKN